MRSLVAACLIILSSVLFINPTYADTCSEYRKRTGLDLNKTECYVLEQVEKGEIAHFKENQSWPHGKYVNRFTKIEYRTLGVDFLKLLITGSIADFKIADEGVRIRHAFISKAVNLKNTNVPFPVEMIDCTFEKEVDFRGSKFSDKALFERARFMADVSFSEVQFYDWADFSNAQFKAEAVFYRAQFLAESNFAGTQLLDNADFSESQFLNNADFSMADFSQNAIFSNAQFLEVANFSNCFFRNSSNFKGCYYNQAIFDNVTGFSNMQMEWVYDLEKFGEEKDEKGIAKRGLKNHLKYNRTFYLALIKNYKDMGWLREADDCYDTYLIERLKRIRTLDDIIEFLFKDLTIGYLKKPHWFLILFLFIWLPFSIYYSGFVQNKTTKKGIKYKFSRFLWASIYSLDNITPGVDLKPISSLNQYFYDFPYYSDCSNSKKILYARRIQNLLGWYFIGVFLNMLINLTAL